MIIESLPPGIVEAIYAASERFVLDSSYRLQGIVLSTECYDALERELINKYNKTTVKATMTTTPGKRSCNIFGIRISEEVIPA